MQPSAARLSPCGYRSLQVMQGKRLLINSVEINKKPKRCSSANTLRIQWLEFGREKLTKGPHMFSQARRHRRCALPPSQTNCSLALACLHWQLGAQTHVWPGDVVERLKENHPMAHLHTVLAEAGGFADQRGQRLAQGQVQAFDQRRADPETALREAFGAEQDAGADGHELALLLLFNQLPVDQLRVGRDDGLAGAPRLPVLGNVVTVWKQAISAAR